jgi:hypothetical protein
VDSPTFDERLLAVLLARGASVLPDLDESGWCCWDHGGTVTCYADNGLPFAVYPYDMEGWDDEGLGEVLTLDEVIALLEEHGEIKRPEVLRA